MMLCSVRDVGFLVDEVSEAVNLPLLACAASLRVSVGGIGPGCGRREGEVS
jgi:hypothetical protein